VIAETDEAATPLTPQERIGLIPTHITQRRELNELEQRNIAEADRWSFSRRRKVLHEPFLRNLHRRMFSKVWRWAGEYRETERNLGIASYRIETELRQAIGDVRYWIDHQSYSIDEAAVRFHHRLVAVHPFPNGNGRWSRLAGDLLVVQQGGMRFTWGRTNLQVADKTRRAYIDALKAADAHDHKALIIFARS
jgi:Fic-DOC domain mobile mystery protein B